MKDELWEKYRDSQMIMFEDQFLAALTEYGELVKAEAVKVCDELARYRLADGNVEYHGDCAAAIKDMELP